ncbi:hypothetical protein HYH03_003151 [Edaphochlamys debaryana]|uniref:Uncharacterized protein n=1 Tax=Edaphochlamys debaryana TaxID=47281 RepID=A0A835Y9U9_9CHLO|nr:hypothetical protein HYH03_003151 [Edaphochlamys debaryana]|eukprot:KAG2498962.1 hypothetical protein HYH03_003151 [Edaphochlamys debaryana]
MLGAALSSAGGAVRRMATGEAPPDDGAHKLTDFLATLATYPALYIFATANAVADVKAPGGRSPHLLPTSAPPGPGAGRGAASGLKGLLPGRGGAGVGTGRGEEGGHGGPLMALAPSPRFRLGDFAEGRALTTLERWCREPLAPGLVSELWYHVREYGRGYCASGLLPPWLANGLGPWLGSFPDAAPPLDLEGVVEAALAEAREGAEAEADSIGAGAGPTVPGGAAAAGWEGGLPLRRLAAAAGPNLAFVAAQLQQRHRLGRGRTWLEFTQIFLGVFRSWLRLVASLLGLAATALRLLGTGATVVSGMVAFTVVFSIALSIVSALLTIAGSAADMVALLLRRLAAATESVSNRSHRARHVVEGDLVGPRSLGPASFEELEELFTYQLAPRLRLKSRPDAARLGGEPLLLRAYDQGLVDASGAVVSDDPDAVAQRFEPSGFFGLAPAAGRKAGAVLLLRLLSWKRVGLCCAGGEALRYVFVLGVRGGGRSTAFARLAHLPLEYKVPPSVPAEIRPLHRQAGAYVVAVPGADSDDPQVAARASHFADLSHGVFSALVYALPSDAEPSASLLGPPVWAALAARKPLLLLLGRGLKLRERIQADPRTVELLAGAWQELLAEGAAARGLEGEGADVLVADLATGEGELPPGVGGSAQLRDWMAGVLEGATTR